ncbi:MAG: hypothetical protein GYB67_13480 [Chloroflexi bacterium]|nr:hypothetical protein [Chloroflexota bacterium]
MPQPNIKPILWIGIVFVFVLAAPLIAAGQDSPTLAPPKTETPPPATPIRVAQAFEPLTQADLSVLTGNVQRPNGFTWHNDFLYTACSGDMTLYEINSRNGATQTYISGVRNAHTLYVEGTGSNLTLWVPDYQTNALARVSRSGGIRPIAEDLEGPWGIAYVNETQFLVTSLLGRSLLLIDREGTTTPVVGNLASPTGVVTDGEWVYVANNGSSRRAIEQYPLDDLLDGGFVPAQADSPSLVSGVQSTTGLQLGSDGYLYFAYALGTRGVVGRVEPAVCREAGGCTNDQVEIVLYTELAAPLAGLTIAPDMRLFVHTMFAPDIYWAQIDF